jgi:hypothetical protein
MGGLAKSISPLVDVMYTLEANEYNGRTSLQLNLKDVKPSVWQIENVPQA